MKTLQLIAFFVFVVLTQTNAQTFCLQLTKVSQTPTTLTVKIEMQGSSAFKLGTSNLQFSFPQDALSNPVLNSSPLAPPVYIVPTVTEPAPGEVSLNIVLPFVTFGTTIAEAGTWTELAQIDFTIDNLNENDDLIWSYNGGTTQTVVFLDLAAPLQLFASSTSTTTCLITLAAPLPIELLSFDAKKRRNTVLLDWTTASESQNKGFEILKSKDAKSWTKIGWVNGRGTTTVENTYLFTDESPYNGTNYYQLKQLDFDGSYHFSDIKQLTFQSSLDELSIYPNPTGNMFSIDYQGVDDIQNILFYDNLGRLVKSIPYQGKDINISTLAEGNYHVLFITATNYFEQTLFIIR